MKDSKKKRKLRPCEGKINGKTKEIFYLGVTDIYLPTDGVYYIFITEKGNELYTNTSGFFFVNMCMFVHNNGKQILYCLKEPSQDLSVYSVRAVFYMSTLHGMRTECLYNNGIAVYNNIFAYPFI